MPPVGFEPTVSAGERPQTYALDRAATVPAVVLCIVYICVVLCIVLFYVLFVIELFWVLFIIVLFYVFFCVNVHCTTATGCQPNCS